MAKIIYYIIRRFYGKDHTFTIQIQDENKQAKLNIILYSILIGLNLVIDFIIFNNFLLTAVISVLILSPAIIINALYIIMGNKWLLNQQAYQKDSPLAKKYAHADIKKHAFTISNLAIACTLGFVIILFSLKSIDHIFIPNDFGVGSIEDPFFIPATTQNKLIPPPVPKDVIIEIVDNKDEIIDPPPIKEVDSDESLPQIPDEIIVEKAPPVPTFAEVMPEFPGGLQKLFKYLSRNISFPSEAIKMGLEGQVLVTFIVEKDGSIKDVQIAKGIGWGCDEEAVRVIKRMPNWNPGKQAGRAIAVKYTIPVKFKISS